MSPGGWIPTFVLITDGKSQDKRLPDSYGREI